MRKFEDDVIISGIGQSEIARRLGRSSLGLTLDAISAALADAGLSGDEVGALFTYPGGGTSLGPGFSGPSLMDVYDAMGLDVNLLMGNYEGPAQLGPILNACLAISSGLARHVVVYRTVTEGSARAAAATSSEQTPSLSQSSLSQSSQWITAFGDGPAPIRYALLARRHFHDFGTTREQLGQIALTARRHASLNPKAVFRQPLTLSEYLNARMIADPLVSLRLRRLLRRLDRVGAVARRLRRGRASGSGAHRGPGNGPAVAGGLRPARRAPAGAAGSRPDVGSYRPGTR